MANARELSQPQFQLAVAEGGGQKTRAADSGQKPRHCPPSPQGLAREGGGAGALEGAGLGGRRLLLSSPPPPLLHTHAPIFWTLPLATSLVLREGGGVGVRRRFSLRSQRAPYPCQASWGEFGTFVFGRLRRVARGRVDGCGLRQMPPSSGDGWTECEVRRGREGGRGGGDWGRGDTHGHSITSQTNTEVTPAGQFCPIRPCPTAELLPLLSRTSPIGGLGFQRMPMAIPIALPMQMGQAKIAASH